MPVGFPRSSVLVTAAVALLTPCLAVAEPAIEFPEKPPYILLENGSLGYEFTTSAALEVTALDAFDASSINYPQYDVPGQVRLYDAAGTVLAEASVTKSDPTEGSPLVFYTHAISPVFLAADTQYFIAEDIVGPYLSAFEIGLSGEQGSPYVTFDTAVGTAGLGQNPTTLNVSGVSEDAVFGPDFDVAVPEPGSLCVLAVGLLGIAIARGRGAARRVA